MNVWSLEKDQEFSPSIREREKRKRNLSPGEKKKHQLPNPKK